VTDENDNGALRREERTECDAEAGFSDDGEGGSMGYLGGSGNSPFGLGRKEQFRQRLRAGGTSLGVLL
jgi:hypothetical protein